MVRLVSYIFLLVFIISCKSKLCTSDYRLIVKEKVELDLSFLEEKTIKENHFNLIFSGKSINTIPIEQIQRNKISYDEMKSVSLISTYEKNDNESWEEYKSYALQNSDLFYLGKLELSILKFYIFLTESTSSYSNNLNRALYMITQGVDEKWCIPIAMNIFDGIDYKMNTTTEKKGDVFIYKDFSDNDNSCGKYKFDNSGKVKILY